MENKTTLPFMMRENLNKYHNRKWKEKAANITHPDMMEECKNIIDVEEGKNS